MFRYSTRIGYIMGDIFLVVFACYMIYGLALR